jgi:formate/nitrite transporter FocA (FNT family)
MNEASDQTDLKPGEEHEAEKRSGPESIVLHQAMVLKGEHELKRPPSSLVWSALAAGIGISTSLVAEGALHEHLPDAGWSRLVTGWGYAVGFVLVIMGRLQLFTEHTVVAVTPVLAAPSFANFEKLLRLWLIVFLFNQLGVLIVAMAFAWFGLGSHELVAAMVEVSRPLLDRNFAETLLQAIPAGFIIAAIAWLIIAAKTGHFWVIALLAYVIAIGDFAHVVASAGSAYLLALTGEASFGWALGGFVLPALIGNVIGGTGLFAVLNYAQIKEEI